MNRPTIRSAKLATLNFIKQCYFSYLSRPVGERPLYRAAARLRARRIVQIGLEMGRRSRRLLQIALWHHPTEQIRFTGIDLFEARPGDVPGMTLKQAHCVLGVTGVRVRLVPGDPLTALSRIANSLTGTDLVVVSADQDSQALRPAWLYIPRMLHPGSQVFVEESSASSGKPVFRALGRGQIERLAKCSPADRRHAA